MRDLTKDEIAKLSLNELRLLANEVEQEIHSRREEGRRWLRQHGLVEKQGRLYRNPKNARETWSGRGRRPEWVEEALASGLELEDLAADGNSEDNLPVRTAKERP